jgi:hypothetical protein
MRRLIPGLIALLLVTAVTARELSRPEPAFAAFHLAEISEVMIGFNGNPDVQFVEIEQRSATSQNFVSGTALAFFNANGTFNQVVLMMNNNVPNEGLGRPWIMGTPAFETAAGIQADFEFQPGIISNAGGMICWGATGGFNNPNNHVDCVAYGTFTGTPTSPPKAPETAGDCQRSLTRTTHATFGPDSPPNHTWAYGNNDNDFIYAAPTPMNNGPMGGPSQPGTLTATDTPDGDGLANCRDTDDDNDTVADTTDNCPLLANAGQEDEDGDAAGDACDPALGNPDADLDGCKDGEELRVSPALGGQRDPLDFWDFFDLTADTSVDLSDALDVLGFFGNPGTTPTANLRDRDAPNMAQPWRSAESDSGIDLTDALVNLAQFGHSCSGPP